MQTHSTNSSAPPLVLLTTCNKLAKLPGPPSTLEAHFALGTPAPASRARKGLVLPQPPADISSLLVAPVASRLSLPGSYAYGGVGSFVRSVGVSVALQEYLCT